MGVGVDTKYSLALYFAELEAVQGLRQFDVSVDNEPISCCIQSNLLDCYCSPSDCSRLRRAQHLPPGNIKICAPTFDQRNGDIHGVAPE